MNRSKLIEIASITTFLLDQTQHRDLPITLGDGKAEESRKELRRGRRRKEKKSGNKR